MSTATSPTTTTPPGAPNRTATWSDSTPPGSTRWPVVRRYTGEQLSRLRMPVGGIGTGCVSFGGRGQLVDWELANRSAKGFTPANSFFAVHVARPDAVSVTRVLERTLTDVEFEGPHGSTSPNHGLPRFRDGSFAAAYPFGQLDLADGDVPLTASIRCFNPLIPGDSDASGIPAVFWEATLHNISEVPLTVSVCGSLTNVIGRRPGHEPAAGNTFEIVESCDHTILLGRAGDLDETDEAHGTLAVACLDASADSARTTWEKRSWGDSLLDFWDDFSDDGRLDRPTEGAPVPTGSLVSRREIGPGDSARFRFMISWHFPNRYAWSHSDEKPGAWVGNHYCQTYTDAADVITQHAAGWDDLDRRTVEFVEFVTGSDLPVPMQDAALSTLAVLKSPTCFRIADGTFLGWEGTNDADGSCHGSCTHVWNYQYAVEALFGDLAWSMRRVELVHSLDQQGKMSFRAELPLDTHGTEWVTAAADGQMGVNQSWYLAALAACVDLAGVVGDTDFAGQCREVLARGAAGTDAAVFNGEYYQQQIIPAIGEDAIAPGLRIRAANGWGGSDDLVDPDLQIGSGCTADQLVGHSMAQLSGLDTGLDPDHVRSALDAVLRHNHRSDFTDHVNHLRSYALGDERGLLACSFPRGDRPRRPFPYCNEVWTGLEYSAAIGLLLVGDLAGADRVVTDVRDRYDGRRRNPFNEVECGHHYVRSMAAWGLVEAWQALSPTPDPRRLLRLCTFCGPKTAHAQQSAGWARAGLAAREWRDGGMGQ